MGFALASRTALTGAGLTRVAIGAGLILRPEALPKAAGVDSSTAQRVTWLSAMVGARDVAIGAGLVAAARRRSDPRPWLLAALLADTVDWAAFTAAALRGHMRPSTGVVCAAAAATGAAAELTALRQMSPATPSSS